MSKAVILGAGTYGEVYLHYLSESGVDIVGFLDDDPTKWHRVVNGAPVLGAISMLQSLKREGIAAVYAPIGNNPLRRRLLGQARELGFDTPCFIHPGSVIASDLKHGTGVYMLPGSVVMPRARLGDDVMVSMGVRIAHHTEIRAGVFLSTGVSLGAGLIVEEEAYFGMNATAVTGKCRLVGRSATVGACSNVISDVAAGITVAGNPARVLPRK